MAYHVHINVRLAPLSAIAALGPAALIATASLPARAFSTQTVGPYNFTIVSTDSASNNPTTLNIPIDPFTDGTSSQLSGVKIIINSATTSGDIIAGNPSPVTANSSASNRLEFTFASTPTSFVQTSSNPVSLSPGAIPQGFTTVSLAGTFTTASTNVLALNPSVQAYFTGSPTIAAGLASYNFNPSTGLLLDLTNATVSGNLSVEYQYVPSPLPIVGAAVAFAHSRRLRKRIKARQATA